MAKRHVHRSYYHHKIKYPKQVTTTSIRLTAGLELHASSESNRTLQLLRCDGRCNDATNCDTSGRRQERDMLIMHTRMTILSGQTPLSTSTSGSLSSYGRLLVCVTFVARIVRRTLRGGGNDDAICRCSSISISKPFIFFPVLLFEFFRALLFFARFWLNRSGSSLIATDKQAQCGHFGPIHDPLELDTDRLLPFPDIHVLASFFVHHRLCSCHWSRGYRVNMEVRGGNEGICRRMWWWW
jgi:hypothetical protein